MEYSSEVLQGLNYLSNSGYISEENFKKIVNSCLSLLLGEPVVERSSSICPEKSDIIKQSYSALLTFIIETIRNNLEEEIKGFLTQLNFKTERIEYFFKAFTSSRDHIFKSLENCQSGWPNLVDTNWRLDYVVKSNVKNQIGEAFYYIVLTTEKNGNLDYIKFTCNLHQIQELSTKLKEIVCHIEKIACV